MNTTLLSVNTPSQSIEPNICGTLQSINLSLTYLSYHSYKMKPLVSSAFFEQRKNLRRKTAESWKVPSFPVSRHFYN